MPEAKLAPKTFEAVLERTTNRLGWVIARIPFDAAKVWGKRGQLRIQGRSTALLSALLSFLMAMAATSLSSTRKCCPAERLLLD